MKKRLKIFLTVIVSIFSFIFIGNVNAYNYNGLELNDEFFNMLWSNFEGKTPANFTRSAYASDYVYHQSDYPYVECTINYNYPTYYFCSFYKNIYYSGTSTTNNRYNFFFGTDPTDSIRFTYVTNTQHIDIENYSTTKNTSSGTPYYNYYWSNLYTANSSYWGYRKTVSNFDIPSIITSSFDYDPNPQPYRFNFYLNGGHASTTYLTPVIELLFNDSEFSISSNDYDIDTFFSRLNVDKENMIFDNFYYDSNFTYPFSMNDNFDDHATVINDEKVINLYAKYRYRTVDDFIDDNNFTEYSFNTDYDYAIINRGNNNGIVYMGLPFNNYELEVYEYQENNSTYKEGSSACLVPIFNKNNIYYYELNTLFTTNQEVLILPKQLFAELNPNDFDDPNDIYKFYLTSNAYVTYTNDLTHVTITNSQGQQVDTNLQNSFELSQQYKNLYADEKDIYDQIKIFLNNITRYTTAIKGMFQYLFNSLNSTIRSFIIFLVVLILLSTILRFIRRG